MGKDGLNARLCPERWPRPVAPEVRDARGAILVQVALMLVGLTALTAFVVDYGILWTARRQIQNAADAAAMAAAASLAFDAPGDLDRARANAVTAAAQNPVWGAPATMTSADVTFPACPSGAVGAGVCIRVQAFRNRDTGNELPTVFAGLAGVRHQGVRATATAQVLFGNSTDCVRPIAVPDRWIDVSGTGSPGVWDPFDTFDTYVPGGDADVYYWPGGLGDNGTGYTRGPTGGQAGDYGRQVRFQPQSDLSQPPGNERFVPIRVTPGATGPLDMLRDIASCSPHVINQDDRLEVETADANGPTRDGITALIALDPGAAWDPTMNNGLGGVAGGCMSTAACTVSPRIVPIVAFDTDHWASRPSTSVIVTRVLGVFIEDYVAPAFIARLVAYPAAPRSSMTEDPASAFVVSVVLVR